MNTKKMVKAIESYRDSMMSLSDEQLQKKTESFLNRIAMGISLDALLPEAFAVVREAGRRVLGMEAYTVQLMSGVELYKGRIAEQATGEGKTLVAAFPAYLVSLLGDGVHVVTVNDYLAKRDADEIGKIHAFLGRSVGCVLHDMDAMARKAAYGCDITYVTNMELGFDYLRDNMAMRADDVVQRDLYYAIIDEADSVLIDEARTPLIISGSSGKSMELYQICDYLVKQMVCGTTSGELTKMDIMNGKSVEESGDFIVNEKDRIVYLTEDGIAKVERAFSLKNFSDEDNLEIQHHMMIALKANNLMQKDVDYVVKDDTVFIVDEFTGRIMPGRRFSDGLHQAIEAKERVPIQKESRTLATITYQNFFNKYKRKCGMTGTAKTEEKEFRMIYGMKVVQIPTNRPLQRVDALDKVYLTKKAKYKAIVDAVREYHGKGQPVLVGTVSIEVSELLSKMFLAKCIEHEVLNAKNHEREADIIAQAGQHGAVTIATNMAGRGTDIKLDEDAREAGGLVVIGTERHESRRIDNQLRGRSGRQGDPGMSQFYISLEDDLMRLFGGEKASQMFRTVGVQEMDVLTHKSLANMVATAQRKIEGNNYGIRKNLMDFDEVNHQQREAVYRLRRSVLCKSDLQDYLQQVMQDVAYDLVEHYCSGRTQTLWDMTGLFLELDDLSPSDALMSVSSQVPKSVKNKSFLVESIYRAILSSYRCKRADFDLEQWSEIEHIAVLKAIDNRWELELNNLEQIRQGIGFMGYGQKDPVVEYKMQAYALYEIMVSELHKLMVRMLLHAHIVCPSGMSVDKVEQIAHEDDIVLESMSDAVGAAKREDLVE